MGDIHIRFSMNLDTGRKDIVIEYASDEDAMRHEHEKRHREIVEQLIGQGLLQADEVGQVTLERVRGAPQAEESGSDGERQAEGAAG